MFHFTFDSYLIMLSVKQRGIKYHLLSLSMTRLGIKPRPPEPLANTNHQANVWYKLTCYTISDEKKKCTRSVVYTFFGYMRFVFIYVRTSEFSLCVYACVGTFTRIYRVYSLFLSGQLSNGPAVRVFASGPGDLGSIPGRVIPKTLKMVLDITLLNTQHYKVRFKGKVEQSWEWSSALPYTLV